MSHVTVRNFPYWKFPDQRPESTAKNSQNNQQRFLDNVHFFLKDGVEGNEKAVLPLSMGTSSNQKCTVLNNLNSLQCPLCHQADSALHIILACQHQATSSMVPGCHNILKAIQASSLGGCFVQMDIGSKDNLALQQLQIPEGSTNTTVLSLSYLTKTDNLLFKCYTSNGDAYLTKNFIRCIPRYLGNRCA